MLYETVSAFEMPISTDTGFDTFDCMFTQPFAYISERPLSTR